MSPCEESYSGQWLFSNTNKQTVRCSKCPIKNQALIWEYKWLKPDQNSVHGPNCKVDESYIQLSSPSPAIYLPLFHSAPTPTPSASCSVGTQRCLAQWRHLLWYFGANIASSGTFLNLYIFSQTCHNPKCDYCRSSSENMWAWQIGLHKVKIFNLQW